MSNIINIVFYCTLGKRFIKMEFINSTTRDRLLVVGTVLIIFTLIFRGLISFFVRNEVYSIYQLISNDYHWTTSILSFIIFLLAEIIIVMDIEVNCIFNFPALYMSLVGMRFWLQRIWYVRIYLYNKIYEFLNAIHSKLHVKYFDPRSL